MLEPEAAREETPLPVLDKCLTIDDLKTLARRRVPKMFFEYTDSGSWTETTYRENEADFQKIKLRQRIAVNLEGRTLKTDMLGIPVAMPVALAPIGATGMQIADGEILAARAAEKFGVPFTLSTMSICSIEDVAENTKAPFWFQLYVMRDRGFIERLIDRAKAAKCSALVLTMDLQILGQRHKDVRNGLAAPPKFTVEARLADRDEAALGARHAGHSAAHVRQYRRPRRERSAISTGSADGRSRSSTRRSTWKDIGWIKDRFGGKIIVKGVLDPEDAKQAIEHGADAIIVSNHGGRQLDGAPSTIRVLPQIVDAVGDKTEVYLDGGIRSGQDILKAVALGAKATFIGRAFLYGLGAGGEAGVTRALDIMRRELDITMALCGERDIRQVGTRNIYHNGLAP